MTKDDERPTFASYVEVHREAQPYADVPPGRVELALLRLAYWLTFTVRPWLNRVHK